MLLVCARNDVASQCSHASLCRLVLLAHRPKGSEGNWVLEASVDHNTTIVPQPDPSNGGTHGRVAPGRCEHGIEIEGGSVCASVLPSTALKDVVY